MKKILTIFALLTLISFNTKAQEQAQAQSNLSTIEAKLEEVKAKLENRGIKVTFNDPNKEKVVHPFIAKWTNEILPEFSLKDINGKVVDSKSLKGKYVHINFWSISCKPCIQEFPELDEIKKKYGDEDIIYLAIAPESSKLVKKIVKKQPLNYVVIANAQKLFEDLGIEGYPKNFFINKDGIIKKITDGTNYKMEVIDEEVKMTPDNFKYYDEIMSKLIK